MSGFGSRFERLELKYLIDELAAEQVRRAIEPFCRPDIHNTEHSTRRSEHSTQRREHNPRRTTPHAFYEVSSLYLDSPGLAFHMAKERGDAERLKLRIRTYPGAGPGAPVVFELKRKVCDVIDKTRAVVVGDVERAAAGFPVAGTRHKDATRFLARFARVVAESGAEPTLRVRYEREAYASVVDEYARVTFDRAIEVQRTRRWNAEEKRERWVCFDDHWLPETRHRNVVLEIKCESFIPWWVTDLVRTHALKRQTFSKYSIGINLTARANGSDGVVKRSARVMQ